MPLPTPKSGEGQDKFISRCMSSDVMNSEYPDQKQRAAVCYSQFRRKGKNSMKINYTTPIIHEELESNGAKKTYIVGNAIEAGISRNKVEYSEDELSAAAKTLIGQPLLINHGDDDVRNIVGQVVEAHYDNGSVPFKAVLDRNETKIIQKIENGFINKVSVGAMYDNALTERDNEGVLHVKGVEFLELSLVPIPGVPNAGISQVLHEKFKAMEEIDMEKEVKELKKKNEELEAKIKEKADEAETNEKPEQEEEKTKEEPVKDEPEEASENYKALQEKLAELEKKVESQKGIVTPEKTGPKFKENWSKSDKEGKKDFWLTDEKNELLY